MGKLLKNKKIKKPKKMKHQFNRTLHIITPIHAGKFSKFTPPPLLWGSRRLCWCVVHSWTTSLWWMNEVLHVLEMKYFIQELRGLSTSSSSSTPCSSSISYSSSTSSGSYSSFTSSSSSSSFCSLLQYFLSLLLAVTYFTPNQFYFCVTICDM